MISKFSIEIVVFVVTFHLHYTPWERTYYWDCTFSAWIENMGDIIGRCLRRQGHSLLQAGDEEIEAWTPRIVIKMAAECFWESVQKFITEGL